MTTPEELENRRRAYARRIMRTAHATDPRLEAALAATQRESFLGPGPWELLRCPGGPQTTPNADPAGLYEDAPVSILPERHLNNGQPSFVTMLIDRCAVREGDRVVHIGTGTGYYTALLARLAGATGRVLGLEIDPALAARAAADLVAFDTTRVLHADGWTHPLPPSDAILVNAGTPRIAGAWLDALAPGGRLVLPLAARDGTQAPTATRGVVVALTRQADGFAARAVSGVAIYACLGAEDPTAEDALRAALEGGGVEAVRRLRREPTDPARCWLRGNGWSLTSA